MASGRHTVGEATLERSRQAPRGDWRQRVGKEKQRNLGDPADGGKVGVVHRPYRRESDGPVIVRKGLISLERRGPPQSHYQYLQELGLQRL